MRGGGPHRIALSEWQARRRRSEGSATLSAFRAGSGKGDPSRFSTRLSVDERDQTGRAPRTFETAGQTVDLGGSYRVTGNLNVTAGVRYSQERDRLTPLTDGKQDGQAAAGHGGSGV